MLQITIEKRNMENEIKQGLVYTGSDEQVNINFKKLEKYLDKLFDVNGKKEK